MDIGKSFTFMFDDENWLTKILIGGIVAIIPIVNFAVLGYTVKVVRNVMDGLELPLPDWGEFGDHFMKGLMLVLALIVYFLPVIILACIVGGAAGIIGREGEALGDMAGIVAGCLQCLYGLWGLLVAILFPAVLIRYAQTGAQFGSAFQFGQIFGIITGNVGNYIIALLLSWVASIIAGFGIIACGIGVLFTGFWSYLVMGHLFGQVGRQAEAAPTF